MAPRPCCLDTKAEYDAFWQEEVSRYCVHQHSNTCRKTQHESKGCRLCFPHEWMAKTGPAQLNCTCSDKENFAFQATFVISPDPKESRLRDFRSSPLRALDTRCIVWELARPRQDATFH